MVLETQNMGQGFRLETLGKSYERRHVAYRWKALILISHSELIILRAKSKDPLKDVVLK